MDGRITNGGSRTNSGPKPGAKAKAAGLQDVLDAAVNDAQRKKIVEALLGIALDTTNPKASIQASAIILNYCYGRPVARSEVSGASGEPLEIVVKYAKD